MRVGGTPLLLAAALGWPSPARAKAYCHRDEEPYLADWDRLQARPPPHSRSTACARC
jgi:hypothetical protein